MFRQTSRSNVSRSNVSRSQRPARNVRAAVTGAVVALVAGGALLGSAGSAGAATQSGAAWVRAAHLVPGLGTMSISLSPFKGSTTSPSAAAGVTAAPSSGGMFAVAPAAGYGMITDYRQVPPGFYTVSVRPAGAAASSAPMITGTLEAKAGKAFTVAGVGTKSAPKLATLTDDLTPPPAGRARVRLLPAANAAKTVTVTARNGPTVAQDAVFGQPTGYATVPAGTWKLTADGGGATGNSSVTLDGGSVYTLLVLDADKGLKIRPVVDAAGVDAMPSGGAQTGGGWLADHDLATADRGATGPGRWVLSALLAVAALGTAIGAGLVAAGPRAGRVRAIAGTERRSS